MTNITCPICNSFSSQTVRGIGVHLSRAHPACDHDHGPHDPCPPQQQGPVAATSSAPTVLNIAEEWISSIEPQPGRNDPDDEISNSGHGNNDSESALDDSGGSIFSSKTNDTQESDSEDEPILARIDTAHQSLPLQQHSVDNQSPSLFPHGPPRPPPPAMKLGHALSTHAQQPVHPATKLPVGKHISPFIVPPTPLPFGSSADPALTNPKLLDNPFDPLKDANSFLFAALCLLKGDLSDLQSVEVENYVEALLDEIFDSNPSLDPSARRPPPLTLPTIRQRLLKSPFLLPVESSHFIDNYGHRYAFVHADLLDSLLHLVGRPHLAAYLQLVPEIHIQLGPNGPERVFGDVHTGDAWAKVYLDSIPPGGLALVYGLSSDKAQIFAKRAIWTLLLSTPMHLFDARAKPDLYAVIPLGFFIQAEKVHADVAQDSRSSSINKLVFHKCLALLFNQRYQDAAIRGIRVRMPTGTWYQGFPRLLYYVGDLPELALFTLTRQGQACPACFTMAPNFMQRVPNLTCRDQKEMEILVENMSACTAAVQTEVGQIMGIHLLYNGLWACPYSNVYQSVVVDELHQLFIGVFGRHLCGAIMKEIDSLADLRTRFYNRLRAVPDFSSSPFRGLTASSFALLTGAEWRALCNVFPSLLIGLFVDELKNDICVAIFALFAEFVHLVCVPNVSETAIAQATQTLDLFFRHLPRFLTAFSHTPDALTFHTLNHFLPCIPRIGSSRHTSTATQMEIHHKNNAKGPAKHTNKHGAIETDTLRRLLIQNALVDHFVFLVLFHPIQRRLYALKSMAQLVQAIEASRPLIPNALPRPHFAQPASPSVSYPTNVPVQLPMRKPNQ